MKIILRAKKFIAALHSMLGLRALRFGVGAGIEHERLLKIIDCRTVVDIGANRGQFSLTAKYCLPHAAIFAFEPLRGPAEIFRRVFEGDTAVELQQVAIGSEAGTGVMHVSKHDDSSSLLPITPMQNKIFPHTQETRTETIEIGHLEDYVSAERIQQPALLKLDVQGYELSSLKGCETLLQCFTYVYVECSFVELYAGQALVGEVIAWLRERNYILCGVHNVTYDRSGKSIQADFFFKRAD